MATRTEDLRVTVIKPPARWELIDFKELWEYRDLFSSMVWRSIQVQYAQTVLGFSWAIINPFIQIILFSVIFGKVAKVSSDGVPYLLFSTVAVIPWTYMSQAISLSSQSLITGGTMLGKIYFPRLIFPLTPVFAKLVDFAISLLLLVTIMIYYRVSPSWNLIYLPIFFLLMIMVPAGIGMYLSAYAIRYRDVKHAMPFVISLLVYTAPILYSASTIPPDFRLLYSLNPIVAVIEGFRSCLLGLPLEWAYIAPGIVTAMIMLLTGALYFRKMERVFVDVL
ncbi:MAG: ABC transporter permease [Pseudomonadota bacterium]|nr:ABC transporter permease [Pseudomonadota bacterium]